MSVLVKGMRMKENCGSCDLFHAESPMHCTVVKGHKTVGAPYGMPRPDWCPLIELPEKHGRLIDADELVQTLDSAINLMESMFDLLELDADDGCLMELKAYRDIRDGIKELDAILEAERVEE